MLGDSEVGVDTAGNIWIKGKEFSGSLALWDLLTQRTVSKNIVTARDLRSYKKILEMTNAHLTEYRPGANFYFTRTKKFREIIAPLFKKGASGSGRGTWQKF